MIQIDRFLNEIERAVFHGGDGFVDRTIGGHQNHGQGGLGAPGLA